MASFSFAPHTASLPRSIYNSLTRLRAQPQRTVILGARGKGRARRSFVVHAAEAIPPKAPPPVEDWRKAEEERERIQEESRQRTAETKREYDAQQAKMRGAVDLPAEMQTPLVDVPATPYVDEDGCIADVSMAGAKATIYAILDQDKSVRYVGVTRGIVPSLRLHMARKPKECYFVKVAHITRPSRAVLEAVRANWIHECGEVSGNDSAAEQNEWENPLDCKSIMSDEDRAIVDAAMEGPERKKALKVVARKFEADILEVIKARGITETFRFDPKLKDTGLLDLKNLEVKGPDTSVPANK